MDFCRVNLIFLRNDSQMNPSRTERVDRKSLEWNLPNLDEIYISNESSGLGKEKRELQCLEIPILVFVLFFSMMNVWNFRCWKKNSNEKKKSCDQSNKCLEFGEEKKKRRFCFRFSKIFSLTKTILWIFYLFYFSLPFLQSLKFWMEFLFFFCSNQKYKKFSQIQA